MRKKKRKPKRTGRKSVEPTWWASMGSPRRKRILTTGVVSVLALAAVFAGFIAVQRLEGHVAQMLAERRSPELVFVDLPESLVGLAEPDLRASVSDLLHRSWTDDKLCRDMATRLGAESWVKEVNSVRRSSRAQFQISCRYRQPIVMIQQGSEFFLVDVEGVRLAGTYRYDPTWHLVQGVERPPPPPGRTWDGEDLPAGLALLAVLLGEPYVDQITTVLVENYLGRTDPHRSHLELATDRAGGRIRWGSAPGLELEENSVDQKIALLRDNFRRTGRADANNPVIDISTFPDRFTIPD